MNLSVEHVLLFLVIVFFLYHLIGNCSCSGNGFSVGSLKSRLDISNLDLDPKNYNRVEYKAIPPRPNTHTYTWTGEKDIGHTTTQITINTSISNTLIGLFNDFRISKIQVMQVGGLPRWLRPYDYVIQITTVDTFRENYWFNDIGDDDAYHIELYQGGIHEISYNSREPKLTYINK